MTIEFQKTLSDIDVILEEMDDELTNKVPVEFRKIISSSKLKGYSSTVRRDIPIENQTLAPKTKAFLAMLYLKYWCEDEEKRRAFKDQLNQNEAMFQKELAEKYSYDNIFKKPEEEQSKETEDIKQEETVVETTQMVTYKESFFKQMINNIVDKIKSLFRR